MGQIRNFIGALRKSLIIFCPQRSGGALKGRSFRVRGIRVLSFSAVSLSKIAKYGTDPLPPFSHASRSRFLGFKSKNLDSILNKFCRFER